MCHLSAVPGRGLSHLTPLLFLAGRLEAIRVWDGSSTDALRLATRMSRNVATLEPDVDSVATSSESADVPPPTIAVKGTNGHDKGVDVLEVASHDEGLASSEPLEPKIKLVRSYFINLPDAVQKRQHLEKMFSRQKLALQRWPGVKLTSWEAAFESTSPFIKFTEGKAMVRESETRDQSRRTFIASVYMSHRSLLEHIASQADVAPDDIFVIVEDDVDIVDHFESQLVGELKQVPNDWDVVRLGFWAKARDDDKVNKHTYRNVDQGSAEYYMGMHAYAVRPRTLPHLLAHLDKKDTITDIDTMIADNPDLHSYLLVKKLVKSPYGSH